MVRAISQTLYGHDELAAAAAAGTIIMRQFPRRGIIAVSCLPPDNVRYHPVHVVSSFIGNFQSFGNNDSLVFIVISIIIIIIIVD